MVAQGKEVKCMDRETIQRLYETEYMRVYSYTMTLAKNRDLAEEIAQETFYRAMSTERTFRGESDVGTWLLSIAKNLFYDEMRKKNREVSEIPEELPDDRKSHEEAVSDADMSFRIHLAMHELQEPYREVFELRVFGELSFAKIGTIFQKTENWARVTYHRAKLQIQERMGEL